MAKNASGQRGEELAAKYLQEKGYKIISRNFHTRFGEIDIICVKNDSLIFVEVKTRGNSSYGTPIEAVTKSKLSKLIATANIYIGKNPDSPKDFSFDVIEVFEKDGKHAIEHTKNVTL